MMEVLLRDLRQPEYIHVLINPLPVYGLATGLIGLGAALILRSRPAQIATLILVLLTAASAWPVYEFGEQGYDRVLTMTDDPGHAWLDEHMRRGEQLIYVFYALAVLAFAALIAPMKWPRSATLFASAVLVLGAVALGCGGYIAYAGGKVRHREFRNVPPPPKKEQTRES
jgi:disulfide bond formation protein DsbB